MSQHWAQFDHQDTKQCLLSDDEASLLIEAWQQSGSFEDTIKELTSKENCHEYQ